MRIYGLNRVPVPAKIQSTISYTKKPDKHKTKELISDYLASSGFNEMMGLSLIESKHYKDLGMVEISDFVYINNTSNIYLDIMRPDMLVSVKQEEMVYINDAASNQFRMITAEELALLQQK